MESGKMNDKGLVIVGSVFLGGLILTIITLAILWALWTFWKPLFPFVAMIAIGALILYVTITIIPKFVKGKQGLKYIIGGLAIGGLFLLIGVLPVMLLSIGSQDTLDYRIFNEIISPTTPFEGEFLSKTVCGDKWSWYWTSLTTGQVELHTVNDFGETVIIEVGNFRGGRGHQASITPAWWEQPEFTGIPSLSASYDKFVSVEGITSGKYISRIYYHEFCKTGSAGNTTDLGTRYLGTIEFWLDNEACELQEGTMVIAETFSAGSTVSKADLRFVPKAYCSQLPILVTEEGQVVEQKLEEYAILDKSFITIPTGQTWTLFYIIDITPDITVVCDEGSYNPTSGNCEVTPGIIHVCSVGIFDPEEALCIVQPEARYVCEIGYYNVEQGLCIYQVPAGETQILCPTGSQIDVDDEGIQRCFFLPDLEAVCEKGSYDSETGACKYLADTEIVLGFTMQQIVLGLFGILALAIAGFFILKGGKK